MDTFLLFAVGLVLIIAVVTMAKVLSMERKSDSGDSLGKAVVEIKESSNQAINKVMADVAERIAKSSSELRQELTDRVNAQFQQIWENLQGQMSRDRQEMKEGFSRASESMEKRLEEIRGKVDERLAGIGREVQSKLDENMKESFKHFEKFREHMIDAEKQLHNVGTVGESINQLNALLTMPHRRGGFGEQSLEMILSDILPAHLYELQCDIGGNGRVDAIVKFPTARLPIDSKFPRESIQGLFETSDKEKLEKARNDLKTYIQTQSREIRKKYICPEEGTTDMALMFLPSELLYFEVVKDVDIWNAMTSQKVYPVSPNTLAITLKSIDLAYRNYRTARQVRETIKGLEMARKHFGHFENRFEAVGKSITNAQEAYRVASTHLQRYSGSVERLIEAGADEKEPETGKDERDAGE